MCGHVDLVLCLRQRKDVSEEIAGVAKVCSVIDNRLVTNLPKFVFSDERLSQASRFFSVLC